MIANMIIASLVSATVGLLIGYFFGSRTYRRAQRMIKIMISGLIKRDVQ